MAIYHLLYRTTTASAVPASVDMPAGRLALNLTDERIYFSNASGVVVQPNVRPHTHPISEITNLQTALDAKAANTVTLTAGVGLTGGGNLTANRTVALGTPSTLTSSTTNSATGTTHTHAVTLTATDVGAIPTADKGAINGVASLNSNVMVPPDQLGSNSGNNLVLTTNSSGVGTWAINAPAVVTNAGTSIALAASMGGQYTRCTAATAVTVTVGAGAAAVNTEFHFRQAAAGAITFVASGTTINAPFGGTLVTAGTGATVTLKCVATNVYDLLGQTTSA